MFGNFAPAIFLYFLFLRTYGYTMLLVTDVVDICAISVSWFCLVMQ